MNEWIHLLLNLPMTTSKGNCTIYFLVQVVKSPTHQHWPSYMMENLCQHMRSQPVGCWSNFHVCNQILYIYIYIYIYIQIYIFRYIFILILILFSWELISKGHNKFLVWECCINLFLLSCVISKLTTRIGKIR